MRKTICAALAVFVFILSACAPKTVPEGGSVVRGDASPKPAANYASLAADEDLVFITEAGNKYHTASCEYNSFPPIAVTRAQALEEGYTPCSRCRPDS